QCKERNRLSQAIVKANIRATKLASTGGFLREGNTTFLIGTDDDEVDQVLEIIKDNCKAREQLLAPMSPLGGSADAYSPYPLEVEVGGATVFVLPVEAFYQF